MKVQNASFSLISTDTRTTRATFVSIFLKILFVGKLERIPLATEDSCTSWSCYPSKSFSTNKCGMIKIRPEFTVCSSSDSNGQPSECSKKTLDSDLDKWNCDLAESYPTFTLGTQVDAPTLTDVFTQS